MLIRKVKYHSDISAAYEKGLEQGFELARKLKRIREEKRLEPSSPRDIHQLEESPLLLQQLIDIAERKVIKLR
jgi:hypothetical protein